MPVMCNHCDDAPCMKAAKNGAVRKRADGIVIIDPEKAKGQKKIMQACPYGAIFWNEEKQHPAGVALRRPPARRGLDPDTGRAGLPD